MADNSPMQPEQGPAPVAYRPRPRKDVQAKRSGRTVKMATTRPVKITLPTDAYESLVLSSLRKGETISGLITDLVRRHLTEWVVHHRPGPKPEA